MTDRNSLNCTANAVEFVDYDVLTSSADFKE